MKFRALIATAALAVMLSPSGAMSQGAEEEVSLIELFIGPSAPSDEADSGERQQAAAVVEPAAAPRATRSWNNPSGGERVEVASASDGSDSGDDAPAPVVTASRQAPAPAPAPAATDGDVELAQASRSNGSWNTPATNGPAQNAVRRNGSFFDVLFGPAPAISGLSPQYRRQSVRYDGPHAPGTIVIDTANRFLYHVHEGGTATRYGVGVGREGFLWKGQAYIGDMREWPGWTPPPEMRKREPWLPAHMPGGPENPLGARAMYLYKGGQDSLYRIHGTNQPDTIGQALSSGCIRMLNEDVEYLYSQVKRGTKVVVI